MYVPCFVYNLLYRPTNAQYIYSNVYNVKYSDMFRCIYIIFSEMKKISRNVGIRYEIDITVNILWACWSSNKLHEIINWSFVLLLVLVFLMLFVLKIMPQVSEPTIISYGNFRIKWATSRNAKKRPCDPHMSIIWTSSITLLIRWVLMGKKSCLNFTQFWI